MFKSRRGSVWSRLLPLILLGMVCAMVALQPRARAAQATMSMAIVDPRAGVLHITAAGLPPQTELILTVLIAPAAQPYSAVQYLQQTASATGSLDFNDPVGIFMCAANVQVFVRTVSPAQTTVTTLGPVSVFPSEMIAQSQPVFVQCPASAPVVGVSAYSAGIATIGGQGFYAEEMTAITVTSKIMGLVATGATQTDAHGSFTLVASVGILLCGDVLTVTASGGAGSMATSAAFINTCVYPPISVKPSPTPRVYVPSFTAPTGAHLTVHPGAATITPHHLETILADTGVASAVVRAIFLVDGTPTASFSVRADNLGRARVTYMAPNTPPPAPVTVQYIISFTVGSRVYSYSGTFQIKAS